MTMVPMYEHDAHVWRARDGWQRWHADCACGWRWTGVGGKQDAERAARAHDGGRLEHTCYDPVTMEYNPDPGPCAACVGEPVNPPPEPSEDAPDWIALHRAAWLRGDYANDAPPPSGMSDAPAESSAAAEIGEYRTGQLPADDEPVETEAERTARIDARDTADSYRQQWIRKWGSR